MLTDPSMTVGVSGSASGISRPICWFLRVPQMVRGEEGHKYPGEG
jgi:hypothetical protein